MKKYILRVLALLIFASVALSGCSVEYRNAHGHHDGDHGHDHDQHYRNY